MSNYDPIPELELESDHPTTSLIQFAIDNYGWEINSTLFGPNHPPLLIHPDYKRYASKWSLCAYGSFNIHYPNWFKKRLLEQIKQKAEEVIVKARLRRHGESIVVMTYNSEGNLDKFLRFDSGVPDLEIKREFAEFIGINPEGLILVETGEPETTQQTGQGWAEPPEIQPLPLPDIHKDFKATAKQLEEDKTLRRIQSEVYDWAMQFGENESHDPRYRRICTGCDGVGEVKSPKQSTKPRTAWDDKVEYIYGPCSECEGVGSLPAKLNSLPPLLGMVEELGEITAPVLKRHQGRGFMDENEYHAAVYDGLADLMIFMCDFANREGIDLTEALNKTWDKVQNRNQSTWQADKDKEVDPLEAPIEQYRRGEIDYFQVTEAIASQLFKEKDEKRSDKDKEIKPSRPLEEILKDPLVITEPVKSNKKPFMDDFEMDEAAEDFHRSQESEEFKESVGMYVDDGLQPTDEDVVDRLIETIDCSDLWEEPQYRKRLYKSVAAIGLQYGDQNLTNIEEGLLKRLMLIAEDAEARLHGRDAREIRKKLNDLRKLRPDLLGEQQSTLEKKTKVDYGTDNA